jgi:hypothetical protein
MDSTGLKAEQENPACLTREIGIEFKSHLPCTWVIPIQRHITSLLRHSRQAKTAGEYIPYRTVRTTLTVAVCKIQTSINRHVEASPPKLSEKYLRTGTNRGQTLTTAVWVVQAIIAHPTAPVTSPRNRARG